MDKLEKLEKKESLNAEMYDQLIEREEIDDISRIYY